MQLSPRATGLLVVAVGAIVAAATSRSVLLLTTLRALLNGRAIYTRIVRDWAQP
jgi:hypothetical protein